MFKWIESKRIKIFILISVAIILFIFAIYLKTIPTTNIIIEKPNKLSLANSSIYNLEAKKKFLLKMRCLNTSISYDNLIKMKNCSGKISPLNNYYSFESNCENDDGIKSKFLLFENLDNYFYTDKEMIFVRDNNLIKVDFEGNFIGKEKIKNKDSLSEISNDKIESYEIKNGVLSFIKNDFSDKDDKKNFKINFSKKQNLNVLYNNDKEIVAGGFVVKEEKYYTYYDDIDVREEEIDKIFKNFNIYFVSPSKDKIIKKISIRNNNNYDDYSYYIKDNYLYVTLEYSYMSKTAGMDEVEKLDLAIYQFNLKNMNLENNYSIQFEGLRNYFYYLNKNLLVIEFYDEIYHERRTFGFYDLSF